MHVYARIHRVDWRAAGLDFMLEGADPATLDPAEREIRRASWLFPLYLVLINLFVIPIAMAGLLTALLLWLPFLPSGAAWGVLWFALKIAFLLLFSILILLWSRHLLFRLRRLLKRQQHR